jgi:hypothetical protein
MMSTPAARSSRAQLRAAVADAEMRRARDPRREDVRSAGSSQFTTDAALA